MILSLYTDRVSGTNLSNYFVDTWYVFKWQLTIKAFNPQISKSDWHYNELI